MLPGMIKVGMIVQSTYACSHISLVRNSLPKFSSAQLSYSKILAQRSAVPAVFSRPEKRGASVSYEDKTRLLRIAKRKRRGLLNSVEDPTELGKGSALLDPSHAVKESGSYDVWASREEDADIDEEKKDFLLPLVRKPAVKAPPLPHPRVEIEVPAVSTPHQGASYNPPVEAHQELLRLAHEKAEVEEKMLERYASVKEKMEAARRVHAEETKPGVPTGMSVDDLAMAEEDEEEGETAEGMAAKKAPARKTAKQRRKAKELQREVRYFSALSSIYITDVYKETGACRTCGAKTHADVLRCNQEYPEIDSAKND